MYQDDQFKLIAKALDSTQKALEEKVDFDDPSILQVTQAKADMIESLSYTTSIDHRLIIETLYNH
ncbi:hypothetical protein [Metabacillus litoralis]|uniref:hypothetical protein n=1 Tax=Metabacillus litoralis TaxID=152268 RepID=UPI001CFD18D5|nr:hypothetical protein [Metabacillus litoralis]